jgi:hypothetical protein
MKIIAKLLLALTLFAYSTAANAQGASTNKLKKQNLYAGIEVGSKGVKMSIISLNKQNIANGSFTIVSDTSINSDFISFTENSYKATLEAVKALYNVAVFDFGIAGNKVYTVFSSGVKIQASKDKKEEEIKRLAAAFSASVNEPARVFSAIDATEEAKLSHIGIVPESRRFNTFLIDIGSGNTKGGYFRNGNLNDLKYFNISWGTKTINNATDKRTEEDKSIANYKKHLARVMAGDPEKEITYAVNESGAYNMNDNFAFSGGIVWSIATLLSPELYENAVIPVSYNEVAACIEKISNNYQDLSADKLAANIAVETSEKETIIKEVKRVHKVFDQKALLAGGTLLLKIMRQFEGTQEKKQFFLVKNGQVGWISAYVVKELQK